MGLEEEPPSELSGDATLPSVREFGDYEMLEVIGHGGMGVVYRVRQKSLDRIVALKFLLFGPHASAESVKRFRAEAAATAALQHPNIVAIHEVGLCEGQHYIAMDYVEGRPLSALIRGNPLPAGRAAGYVKAIAEAIHYAHEHGILHRDLKPANVLIDANDQPRVTDFGLAKRLDDSRLSTLDSELTVTGQVLGSPNYMPPEQASGRCGTLSRRSDVYALGAILYHALTGRPPFVGEGMADTVQQVLNEEPASPRLLNPGVPRDLETVCLKCLHKEPARRYASAQALAEDLERWLRAEPIQARRATQVERVWLWCVRQPVRAGLIGALVLTFMLGLSGVIWQWRLAGAETLRARQNAYAADMNLAQAALEKSDVAGALEALNRQRPSPGQQDLRGWEWRYFRQRCREAGGKSALPSPVVLPIPVASAALSLAPDSKHFITLDNRDGVASLWSILPLGLVEKLSFLGTNNTAVRWSPDGRTLAVGDRSGTVRIWDFETRRAITNFANPGTRVGTLKFYGGGRTLFCGLSFRDPNAPNSDARHAKFRDTRTWAEIRLPPDFPGGRGRWAAVSADNRVLAALDDQGTVVWWEMASGRRLKRFEHHFGRNDGYLTFSPVAPLLAGSTTDGVTTIWDVTTGRVVTTIRANFKAVHGIAFSPDGQRLLSGGKDPSDVVRLLDLGSQRHVATLGGPPDSYWFLEMSKDLTTLVASSSGQTALLWRAPTWAEIEAVEKGQVAP
jgi:eukaryotic-like serine/threonine-protein kinase